MVYAFILHTLLPGPCKILFYDIYGKDVLAKDAEGGDIEAAKRERKSQIQYVASQVHSEYQYRRAVNNRSVEEDIQALNQDDRLPQFELGYLRFPADAPFTDDKIAVWLGAGNTGFTLVCYKEENRTLAEIVLKHIIRYTQEYLRVLTQPAEASLKADRVLLILNRFLPDGTLVFMNHRVVRGLERELEIQMKT